MSSAKLPIHRVSCRLHGRRSAAAGTIVTYRFASIPLHSWRPSAETAATVPEAPYLAEEPQEAHDASACLLAATADGASPSARLPTTVFCGPTPRDAHPSVPREESLVRK